MDLVTYALLFIGTPYGWGADGPIQYDCSGFIQQVLASEGIDPRGDQTAQNLFDRLRRAYETHTINPITHVDRNHLLFFGSTTDRITHIALAIDNEKMIESGGGGSRTKTVEDAAKDNAMVRVRKINNRGDLVAVMKM